MYHVISKARDANGKAAVLQGNIESRDEARAYARAHEGTVKTDAELTQLIGDGKISAPTTNAHQEPATMTTETAEAPAGNTGDQPQDAAHEAENKAPASISDAADAVAQEQSKRTTVGKKAKPEPKRVKTPDAVLADARADMALWAAKVRAGEMSKVEFVRNVALWNGRKLQRSDAILLTAELQLGIASATVSTQFQFARSDRMVEHAKKAEARANEAHEREAKAAEAKAAKEKAKAEKKAAKEAEEKAKAEKKAADKAAKEAAAAKEQQQEQASA